MKKLSYSLVILSLAMTAFLAQSRSASAEDARLVRLSSNVAQGRSYQIPFNVEPENLLIRKDSVVVWALFGAHHAQVVFLDGKKCETATEAPVGFELDSGGAKACYRGVLIPNGGTASLKFKNEGVYEYEVQWENHPQPTRAKVIVH